MSNYSTFTFLEIHEETTEWAKLAEIETICKNPGDYVKSLNSQIDSFQKQLEEEFAVGGLELHERR